MPPGDNPIAVNKYYYYYYYYYYYDASEISDLIIDIELNLNVDTQIIPVIIGVNRTTLIILQKGAAYRENTKEIQ